MLNPSLARRACAELLGTTFLLIAVVGSGIAAVRLSPGDAGVELLENAFATGAALVAILLAIGPVSGAHLNPIVTLVDRVFGGVTTRETFVYCGAQLIGAATGAVVANLMFDLDPVTISTRSRATTGHGVAELVATLGLLVVIFGIARAGRGAVTPFAVGAYISAAYFFTSSTSFANPAVTAARTLSNTLTGIAPASAPLFVGAQLLGGALAVVVIRVVYPRASEAAPDVVVPHEHEIAA